MSVYKSVSPEKAISLVKSNHNVWVHSAGCTPSVLIKALVKRAPELTNVNIYQLHTEGDAPYAQPEVANSFIVNAFFIGSNCRQAVNEGRANYIPAFLSEVPVLLRREVIPIDVALVHISPPDKLGFCSLGISVEATLAGIEMAEIVIAQINPQMPRTHGDGIIHVSKIDHFVEVNEPIPQVIPKPSSYIENQIGQHCASLIDDRSTLQMGIGAIPNAVLKCLGNHKDLGVHTEMFSDGLLPLIESGVVTGKYKQKHPHAIVTGFIVGSKKLYDFVDDNPLVRVLDVEYVNKTNVIRQNPKVVSINSAIEIDLTGQVCADSIGTRLYSGVGGQMDFIRGASLSEGGKPIIALPSTTKTGESRLVGFLRQGAGVVTTRAHVHYVVTEYGVANLYGKPLKQRAKELIAIAHPQHREMLEKQAVERFNKVV
ncbi:MAG: acetyl-CoA hydrolase/transferase family protein [Bacteroidetes bacterium]|nr:acetyl-CoA hydrolase/transferase family protein [Bacteroidota bacterium]